MRATCMTPAWSNSCKSNADTPYVKPGGWSQAVHGKECGASASAAETRRGQALGRPGFCALEFDVLPLERHDLIASAFSESGTPSRTRAAPLARAGRPPPTSASALGTSRATGGVQAPSMRRRPESRAGSLAIAISHQDQNEIRTALFSIPVC